MNPLDALGTAITAADQAGIAVLALGLLKLGDDRLAAWLVDVTSDEHERLALAEHLALATEAAGIGTFELRYDGSDPLHFNVQTFRLFGHPDGGSPQQNEMAARARSTLGAAGTRSDASASSARTVARLRRSTSLSSSIASSSSHRGSASRYT